MKVIEEPELFFYPSDDLDFVLPLEEKNRYDQYEMINEIENSRYIDFFNDA